jgi:hypothetical protein
MFAQLVSFDTRHAVVVHGPALQTSKRWHPAETRPPHVIMDNPLKTVAAP